MVKELRKFTWEDLKKEKDKATLLMISGKVYDVSKWKEHHPGGGEILQIMSGQDVTDPFLAYHAKEIYPKLKPFLVGELVGYEETEMQKEYHALMETLDKEGLYVTDLFWYFKHISCLVALFLTGVLCGMYGPNFFVRIFGAMCVGLFWQQLSFLGHDFGHKAVFHNSKLDLIAAILVTAFMGVSGNWWRRVHNTHHVATNSQNYDPDIQYLPLFAVNKTSCRDYFSYYHKRFFKFDTPSKLLVSYQHILYLPILCVARFNLYALGWTHMYGPNVKVTKDVYYERAALVFFLVWNLWLLSYMPDKVTLFFFLLISHSMTGIVHVQIILSHFAMETYDGLKEGDDHFVKNQLSSTMNWESTPFWDWIHGGLQFQIEHHLFPKVPRHRLRFLRSKYVIPFCQKYKLPYTEVSFLEANLMVMRAMREAAMVARKQRDVIFQDSFLWKLLSAQG